MEGEQKSFNLDNKYFWWQAMYAVKHDLVGSVWINYNDNPGLALQE